MAKIYTIPVTKSKGVIDIDVDTIPDEVYAEAVRLGLKELVNRGMTKITKAAFNDADAVKNGHANGEAHMKAEAQAKAAANVQDILVGKIRFSAGAKAKKASGFVMTEARRLAKNIVKDLIKKNGGRISHFEAKEITAAGNALLESEAGAEIMAQAEQNIKEREQVKIEGIDIMSLVKASPALVAKAEKRNAEKKQLSAKQAGMTAPRAKAKAAPQASA